MAFDPDAFLSEPTAQTAQFDPDAFLGSNTPSGSSMAEQQLAAGLLGGTGQPMSREDALQIAMERMVKRSAMEGNPNIQMVTAPDTFITRNLGGFAGIPTPGQQNVVDVSQISGLGVPLSKARAISSGQTFGATDALERLIQDVIAKTGLTTPEAVQSLGVQAQRAQNPEDELALNILGGVLPGSANINALMKATAKPSTFSRIVSGAGQGLKGGLAVGVNEAITQKGLEDPLETLLTVPETSALPVATGVTLGAGIPALSGLVTSTGKGIGAVAKNTPKALTPQFENAVTDVIKPPKAARGDLIKDLESGLIQDSLRSISAQGKPTGLTDALGKSIPVVEDLSNRISSFIDSNVDIKLTNDDVADEIISLADSKRFRADSVKNALKDFAGKFRGERTLRQGFDDLNELNELRRSYFQKSNAGQATDLDNLMHEAEQLARDKVSRKLDDIYRATSGNTDNPYQQYGALKGLIGDLTERGEELITDQRIKRSKGINLEREVLATLKSNAELLTGGEAARIDRRIVDMFNFLESSPQPTRIRNLTPAEQEVGASNLDNLLRQSILRESSRQLNPSPGLRVPLGQGLQNIGETPIASQGENSLLDELIRQASLREEQGAINALGRAERENYRRSLEEMMK